MFRGRLFIICWRAMLILALLAVTAQAQQSTLTVEPDLSPPGFAIEVNGAVNPHAVLAVTVMPGETLELRIVEPLPDKTYRLLATAGEPKRIEAGLAHWNAPDSPGMYPLQIVDTQDGGLMTLNVFVLRPAAEVRDEKLNGYLIGEYPDEPLNNDPQTLPPRGFIEVQPEDLDTPVAPHFRLQQFLCKQVGAYPKYLLLDPKLLIKLEAILKQVNEAGFPAKTLHVMSGYRTPWYNESIGNADYSQHLWGRAADIFVDMDGDNWMDDLNGDGRSDVNDAKFMHAIVTNMGNQPWYKPLTGGLGLYRTASHRSAFIHVDTRGVPARW